MVSKPSPTAGMRHVALYVRDLEACVDFYTRLLDMQIEWNPDQDNVYLSSGCDNLALHRHPDADPCAGQSASDQSASGQSASSQGREEKPPLERLDHIGFIIDRIEHVDQWYEWLRTQGVQTLAPPRTHRDGARSFYCHDPDGTLVQIIYHPPISAKWVNKK